MGILALYIVRTIPTFYSQASKVIVKIRHDAQPTQNCTILLFLRDHDYDLTTKLTNTVVDLRIKKIGADHPYTLDAIHHSKLWSET